MATRQAIQAPATHSAPVPTPAKRHDAVAYYPCHADRDLRTHESAMLIEVAQTLAAIKQCAYAGRFDDAVHDPRALYLVPSETLIGADLPERLGLRDEHDLFGGVVPFAFIATKTITHPLPDADSVAPEGWSFEFGRKVHDVVLPGFSAFALRDARIAGERLLQGGAVRVKKAAGIGGLGQSVVNDLAQLDSELHTLSDDEWSNGIVLERNLTQVTTLSVGQARVHDLLATYIGSQRLTTNNHGDEVYGGSTLTVVRGDYDTLLRRALSAQQRAAIAQARTYHDAAMSSFHGMYASRCNYDIAQGLDPAGHWISGVLEQSWRIGGASCAEVAALQALHNDATLKAIDASTTEIYGANPVVPVGALVYFSGVDEHAGPMTKCSQVQAHDHA